MILTQPLFKICYFQVGRSSDSKIDFVVLDTVPGPKQPGAVANPQKSTISRYACRITVDRQDAHTARVFAAGFDGTNNIFLGVSTVCLRIVYNVFHCCCCL